MIFFVVILTLLAHYVKSGGNRQVVNGELIFDMIDWEFTIIPLPTGLAWTFYNKWLSNKNDKECVLDSIYNTGFDCDEDTQLCTHIWNRVIQNHNKNRLDLHYHNCLRRKQDIKNTDLVQMALKKKAQDQHKKKQAAEKHAAEKSKKEVPKTEL